MLQGSKLEIIEKINSVNELSEQGSTELPDALCSFLVENFNLQSSVLFKVVNTETIVVHGRSLNAKKNFLKSSTFNLNLSSLFNLSSNFSINTEISSELQISEFVIYEAAIYFRVNKTVSAFLKIARESAFTQADVEALNKICKFLSHSLNTWFIAQGEKSLLSKQEFHQTVSEISQHLRNPLNTIIGFSSILTENNLNSSQLEYTTTIRKNAQSLLVSINDLIELTKLDENNLPNTLAPTNIFDLIKDLIESISKKNPEKKIDFSFKYDKTIPTSIEIDDVKVRAIISNILSFSAALIETGKINIILKSESGILKLIVGDTSDGIPNNILSSIFTPFEIHKLPQLKNSSVSGLLLTLTEKYVSLLGGKIKIESILGKGNSINIDIPADLQLKEKTGQPRIENLPQPTVTQNKILVIEDDYASSKLLSNYLNKWGYNPTIVNSEDQTLSLISKESFVAVIMDINLPNANGLELLRKIHNHPNAKNTPVIACSVEAEEQKAYLMGAVEYFQKPINYNFLVEVLTNYKLRKNSNILCVDDDVPTLNLVKQAIQTAGFNAVAENVSANVMDLIKDKDIDLAIVDLDMPSPNGFELIKLIKSNPKFANLPIIIYTGKDNFEEDLKQIDGLFEELLDKRSVNIEDLADTINAMVNKIETPPPVEEVIDKPDNEVKILFAEDYKHSQIIVTRLLKKNNFQNVAVVENGAEALELAQKEHFNLILMDMQMPVMNGFEAIEKIRQMEDYKETPIIALTAFAMKGDREKCLDAGATDYIPKPIDSKEFIEKVKYYTNTLK